MIDRVHPHPTHMRSPASPAGASCFTARNVHMIDIADLANSRETVSVNAANFARRHFHQRVAGFECGKRGLLSGTACDLAASAGSQFNVERSCREELREAAANSPNQAQHQSR